MVASSAHPPLVLQDVSMDLLSKTRRRRGRVGRPSTLGPVIAVIASPRKAVVVLFLSCRMVVSIAVSQPRSLAVGQIPRGTAMTAIIIVIWANWCPPIAAWTPSSIPGSLRDVTLTVSKICTHWRPRRQAAVALPGPSDGPRIPLSGKSHLLLFFLDKLFWNASDGLLRREEQGPEFGRERRRQRLEKAREGNLKLAGVRVLMYAHTDRWRQ